MTKVAVLRAGEGLRPFSESDAAVLRSLRSDLVYRLPITVMRNSRFFRKWYALAQFAFDVWCEHAPAQTHAGGTVRPNFESFRKNLIILAGFGEPVFNLDGTFRVEAKSISWANMSEAEFDRLYDATIDAILENVVGMGGMTIPRMKAVVEETLRFAE